MSAQAEISVKDAYLSFVSTIRNVEGINAGVLEAMASSDATKKVNSAQTCLSIGPCTGSWEIDFIKHLLPNLKMLTAVESDEAAVPQLVQNLNRDLPDVVCDVHQKTCREFLDSEERIGKSFDVVLFFNVLYYVTDDERKALFEALYDGNLLSDGGSVIIEQGINFDSSKYTQAVMRYRLEDELRPTRRRVLMDTIKKEAAVSGFSIYHETEYLVDHDFSEPDDALVAFFSSCLVFRKLSMEEFQLALQKIQPSGKFACNYGFIWLEKH